MNPINQCSKCGSSVKWTGETGICSFCAETYNIKEYSSNVRAQSNEFNELEKLIREVYSPSTDTVAYEERLDRLEENYASLTEQLRLSMQQIEDYNKHGDFKDPRLDIPNGRLDEFVRILLKSNFPNRIELVQSALRLTVEQWFRYVRSINLADNGFWKIVKIKPNREKMMYEDAYTASRLTAEALNNLMDIYSNNGAQALVHGQKEMVEDFEESDFIKKAEYLQSNHYNQIDFDIGIKKIMLADDGRLKRFIKEGKYLNKWDERLIKTQKKRHTYLTEKNIDIPKNILRDFYHLNKFKKNYS